MSKMSIIYNNNVDKEVFIMFFFYRSLYRVKILSFDTRQKVKKGSVNSLFIQFVLIKTEGHLLRQLHLAKAFALSSVLA